MCMQLMESTDLIPMDGDVAKITKRAEEFRELPDALQRNLQTFLTLTMDILAAVHQKAKASSLPDVTRQMVRVLDVTYTDCSLTSDWFGRPLRRCAKNRGRSSSLRATSSTGCHPTCTRISRGSMWRSLCNCYCCYLLCLVSRCSRYRHVEWDHLAPDTRLP